MSYKYFGRCRIRVSYPDKKFSFVFNHIFFILKYILTIAGLTHISGACQLAAESNRWYRNVAKDNSGTFLYAGRYNHVTWASWRLKSTPTQLFVQQLYRTKRWIKKPIKSRDYWPFVRGIIGWTFTAGQCVVHIWYYENVWNRELLSFQGICKRFRNSWRWWGLVCGCRCTSRSGHVFLQRHQDLPPTGTYCNRGVIYLLCYFNYPYIFEPKTV